MLHTKQEVTDTEYYSKAADYWENVTPIINGMLGQQLVRAECVRCPWALLRNEVSTIFGIIFLLWATYFSHGRVCPRVMKFCTEF